MDDRDFADLLFQQFAKTTGAEDTFWMPEEDEGHWANGPGTWNIWSVDKNQSKMPVAQGFENEADADFITAVHGCLPDLVRRLHDALDEADRLDRERDGREQEIFAMALEVEELQDELRTVKSERDEANSYADGMAEENRMLEGKLATAASKAGDALWKIERPM